MTTTDLYNNLTEFKIIKDYTVSNEKFKILYNDKYDLLVTKPVPKDLDKYYDSIEYISHTDSNKTAIDKIYKIVRNYTLKKKLKLINKHNNGDKNILDIGSGTGDFLKICKLNNWNISGVEPSQKARDIAKEKNIILNKDINFITGKFDIITMWHVLEHVPNLIEYIEKLKKLLNKNGTIIIAVPNYKSYDAKYYQQYWAAYDVPRHLWHFSKTTISKLFALVNMEVIKIKPMLFDSYYVSLLSTKYKYGKMKPLKAFYTGLKSNIKGNRIKEYSSHIYIIKNSK